jgi:hypothetical protein
VVALGLLLLSLVHLGASLLFQLGSQNLEDLDHLLRVFLVLLRNRLG